MISNSPSRFTTLTCMLILVSYSVLYGQVPDMNKSLWSANWSHDNQYIAVGGLDKKIRIFNGRTFELTKVFDNTTKIQRLSWHPFLNRLAVAATGDGSKIIDVETDSIINLKGSNANGTRAIAWNCKGDLLANADYEGEITIWTQHGELIRTIKKENTKSNVAIDWHPSKNEFIALSESVRIYDSNGTLLNKFDHRNENVLMLCVKWHKSGDFFVIGDYGDNERGYKPLLQYRKSNGELIKEMDISRAEYRNVSWTNDGNKLATASDALRIWTKTGELMVEAQSEDLLFGVDWNPDDRFIVTSSAGGHIKIWDSNAKLIKEIIY